MREVFVWTSDWRTVRSKGGLKGINLKASEINSLQRMQNRTMEGNVTGRNSTNELSTIAIVNITVEIIIAVAAVTGNSFVCLAVYKNRRLRGTTNYFIVSLAVADICVGLLGIPFAIVTYLGFPHNFHGCLMMLSFIIITTQSSIFSLLAIAVDRYVAIMNPLRYEYLMTTRTARWAIALTWALSLLIGMVPLMGWNLGPSQNGCAFTAVIDFDYFVYFNFFGCVLTPLLIMGFIYSTIFWSVRKQLRSIKSTDITTSAIEKKKKYFKKEVKAAKSLAIIVGLFAVCWLPLHTLNCIDHLCREACPYPYELLMTAILLSHANSAVNPVIYAFRNRDYRNTFKSLVQSCFFCCPWTETVFNLSDQSVSESRHNQIQLNAFNRSQINLIHGALSQSQPAVNQLNSRSPSKLSVVQEPTENVNHENSMVGKILKARQSDLSLTSITTNQINELE
ncbi:adenosine receptor A2b-like [Branchiostoma floridae x Branchiostoma belcheri]